MEQMYRLDYGDFTLELDSLRKVNWEVPPLRHFERPRVAFSGERLCITLKPKSALRRAWHVNEHGVVARGPDCD